MKRLGIIAIAAATLALMSCTGSKSEPKETQETSTVAAKPAKKVIVARLKVKPGQEQAFIDVAAKLVEATHQEPGNLFYNLYQSPLNPVEFIFYEEYKDEAAFKTHSESAAFAAFAEGIKDLADGALQVDEY